ncbi:30S ribosome-binding factor RbfA [Legionella sp. W05-934-2]|jgi:ribosome-binding factor A|uniref:30S ribosome-binding factor RbfA n=1 Tax=Legionella sp. W05-934-2 TaxID=1198649 RepID=UPI003462F319
MSASFKRTDRIAELMLRKLSTLIQQEIKDPRLTAMITLSGVHVTSDLSYAKVYFTVLNGDEHETKQILNQAAPYLRSVLAKSMTTRKVPELTFVYDTSIEYGKKLSKLIDDVNPDDDQETR